MDFSTEEKLIIFAVIIALALLYYICEHLRELVIATKTIQESTRLENIENSLQHIRYDVSAIQSTLEPRVEHDTWSKSDA